MFCWVKEMFCFFFYPEHTPLYVNWHYLNSCSNYIKLHCVSEQVFDVELLVFENTVEHTREEIMFMYVILCSYNVLLFGCRIKTCIKYQSKSKLQVISKIKIKREIYKNKCPACQFRVCLFQVMSQEAWPTVEVYMSCYVGVACFL